MAINSEDTLINAMGNNKQFFSTNKQALANSGTGQFFSYWRAIGNPVQAAIPGAAATCDATTQGAIPYNSATGGAFSYLTRIGLWASQAGTFLLYDRLSHVGNLSGIVTTAQTVGCTIPTGRDGAGNSSAAANFGVGVEGFLECYTDLGSTTVTATVSYTNSAGTSGRTITLTLTAVIRAGRLLPLLPLQSGDVGIRSIDSVTLSATTGTAGAFGFTLGRKIADIGIAAANLPNALDAIQAGLPRIYDSACLWWMTIVNSSQAQFVASTDISQG